MQKLKISLRYLQSFFIKRNLLILLFVILLSITLGVLIYFYLESARPVVKEGIVGTFTESNLPEQVTSLLSQGLVKFDANGKPIPNLAEKWEANKDANEYTFKLRDNIFWSDSTPVQSTDLDFPFPNTKISYPDSKTIQFKLSDSFAPFPSLLSKPIFKKGTLKGVGPYKVTAIKKGKDQVFVTEVRLSTLDKSLPNLIIRFYDNEKKVKNALRLGDIQVILGVNEISDISNEKNLMTWSKTNNTQLVTIFYNTKDPILSDENFRLALSFASPEIKGERIAKTSVPQTSWAFTENVKDYLDNTAQAKTYLAKVQNGKDTTIALTATSFLRNVGERVVEEWNKNGIKAVLRVESGVPQNFQALLITQSLPMDPDQYALWHSTQVNTNISKISSPRLDKDLEDGRKELDMEKRKAKYTDFQKVLMDQSPATFLYFPKYNVVYMKKVESDLQKILAIQLPYLN